MQINMYVRYYELADEILLRHESRYVLANIVK